MNPLNITVQRADLDLAARQEALRWQAYVRRVPLFVLTAFALAAAGVGIMRGFSTVSPTLQVLAVLGYSVFYWGVFTIVRLVQGWFKARRASRARFGKREEQTVRLELVDGLIKIREERWALDIPVNRILSTYMTKDFVFFESAFLPWLPLGRSSEMKQFLAELRTAGTKKEAAPVEEAAPSNSESNGDA